MTINLKDVAAKIVGRGVEDKVKAQEVTQAVFDELLASLTAGEKVQIAGFGVFEMVTTKQRTARNPKTGEAIIVMPYKKLVFKPVQALRKIK